jgi:hypothetical protein
MAVIVSEEYLSMQPTRLAVSFRLRDVREKEPYRHIYEKRAVSLVLVFIQLLQNSFDCSQAMFSSNTSGKYCAKMTSSFQYAVNESLHIWIMFDPEEMLVAFLDDRCQLPSDRLAILA